MMTSPIWFRGISPFPSFNGVITYQNGRQYAGKIMDTTISIKDNNGADINIPLRSIKEIQVDPVEKGSK